MRRALVREEAAPQGWSLGIFLKRGGGNTHKKQTKTGARSLKSREKTSKGPPFWREGFFSVGARCARTVMPLALCGGGSGGAVFPGFFPSSLRVSLLSLFASVSPPGAARDRWTCSRARDLSSFDYKGSTHTRTRTHTHTRARLGGKKRRCASIRHLVREPF